MKGSLTTEPYHAGSVEARPRSTSRRSREWPTFAVALRLTGAKEDLSEARLRGGARQESSARALGGSQHHLAFNAWILVRGIVGVPWRALVIPPKVGQPQIPHQLSELPSMTDEILPLPEVA